VFDPNGPGGFNGPPGYQRPPQKNRAGLFIVLLVVMLIAVLGIGGVVTYNLVSDKSPSPDTTEPGGLDPSDIPTEIPSDFPSYLPSEDPTEVPTVPENTVPTSGAGDLAVAKALAAKFVGNLNANKTSAALAMACKESKDLLPLVLDALVAPPTKLTIGEALGQSTVIVRVSGSTKGHNVSGLVVVQKPQGEPLCIRVISLTPN
jgi:hypothetical protein